MSALALDPCCGARMFYFDKDNPNVLFCDERDVTETLCDGRFFEVNPDKIADVTALPFDDGMFPLVVFDPPHLTRAGKSGWQAIKYGVLPDDWREWMTKAFSECWRVLADNGTLVFKWYEYRIKLSEVLECAPVAPLFGNRKPTNSKTHWLVFFKVATYNEADDQKAHMPDRVVKPIQKTDEDGYTEFICPDCGEEIDWKARPYNGDFVLTGFSSYCKGCGAKVIA